MTYEEARRMLVMHQAWAKSQSKRYAEAVDVAIKAIEKQIPKKQRYDKWQNSEYWHCPNCNEVVFAKLKDEPIKNEYNHSCCGCCGQHLDWSDEE